MADEKQAIDEALGAGYYADWQQKERDAADQMMRTAANKKLFHQSNVDSLNAFWGDSDLLEEVLMEYRDAMKLIIDGKSYSHRKTEVLNECVSLATGVVEHNNDHMGQFNAAGMFYMWVEIPYALIKRQAAVLEVRLKNLKKLLEKAKNERLEAWGEAAVNAAVTTVTFMLPQVGFIGRGIAFVGLWLLDDVWGPDTSTPVNVGDKTSLSVSHIGDSMDEVDRLSSQTKKIVKKVGKGATVVGFVFDANEVLVGYRNVDEIRTEINRSKRSLKSLSDTVKRNKAALTKYKWTVQRLKANMRGTVAARNELRVALHTRLRMEGYSP